MASILNKIIKKELLPKDSFPHWIQKSVQYEAQVGSVAYGCSTNTSDLDIYGFCFPPKKNAYPVILHIRHLTLQIVQEFENHNMES